MNKRIKELMLEAGYAAPEIALRAQKLAELIIQECIEVVIDCDEDPKLILHEPYRIIMNKLDEHFGDKE